MPDARSKVGRYYDRNTPRFLRFGHGGANRAIRRAVWGPSARDRGEAIDYVNALILGELGRIDAGFVMDLGCGVGGSIAYLSHRHPARYLGATISGVQVRIGSRFLRDESIPDAKIVGSDFTSDDFVESLPEKADCALAVESLLHVADLKQRMDSVARLVRPGGRLVVCDDMISRSAAGRDRTSREERLLREFRVGWHAVGLTPVDQFFESARAAGLLLLESRDLTPYLELDRTRDLAARAMLRAFRWLPLRPPWFSNLLGGNALQLCLKGGVIRYIYAVFERV